MGRIAYVTPDFQVFTVSPGGGDAVRVSPDRSDVRVATPDDRFVWPLWFPAGDRLLFSRIQPPDQFGSRVALVSAASNGSDAEPIVVYEDDPATNGIGGSAPHYTAFSPDGTRLAAIVGTRDGLVLTVFDATRPGSRGVDLVLGAPLYLDWSYDSSTLTVHLGERLLTFENVLDGGLPAAETAAPVSFFAPAASPVAARTAVVAELAAGPELRLAGEDERFVAVTPAQSLFDWSPDGSRLALLRQSSAIVPPGLFDELAVITFGPDGAPSERIERFNLPMRSFWWAPDSRRLALTVADLENPLRTTWEVLDVESGESVEVASIIHSADFDFTQVFAGQYLRSHTFWSPDSTRLVLTGVLDPSGGDSATPGVDEVWVVSADGQTPPRSIGPGRVAFWSPR